MAVASFGLPIVRDHYQQPTPHTSTCRGEQPDMLLGLWLSIVQYTVSPRKVHECQDNVPQVVLAGQIHLTAKLCIRHR